jgi:hypothetical protein
MKIEAIENPMQRNLLITMAYSDLAVQVDCLLGHRDLNWCSFGTWASKTAGKSIRKELPAFPIWMSRIISRLPIARGKMQRCSENIAEGNLKVFSELAPFFAEMVQTFRCDEHPDWEKFDRFTHRIRESREYEDGNFSRLVRGFRQYYLATFEEDLDRKAEHIFFGNCLLAVHEQIRLQPDIVDALKLRSIKTKTMNWLWHWFATRHLMRIEIGDRSLPLGKRVKVRTGRMPFSPELQELENEDLILFLGAFDRYINRLDKSAAMNWAVVGDRMKFITKLFRSHQRDRSLLDCPFTPNQQQQLVTGAIPGGRL